MKYLILLISVIVLGANCALSVTPTVQKNHIRYTETIQSSASSFNNQGLPLKTDRLSNNEGTIILTYDESLPDSIHTSLLAAKKLWESKLHTIQPIYISVSFEPLGEDIAMIADVTYCGQSDLTDCPCALASQISNVAYGSIDSPDGLIILNSDIDWNCRFSKDATSEYNLPTMIIRGIAKCLGFGSCIIEDGPNQLSFLWGVPSYFDQLLHCNSTAISELREGSPEMANFVTSNNVYLRSESRDHKIYAPKTFIPYKSLCYFDDNNSIMSYSLGQGNIDLSIDDKTLDILKTIGWRVLQATLSIRCNNITASGIGSSYESHTFSLDKKNENVSNFSWRFLLKNKQGEYTQISNGDTETFTIDKISSPDNFYININGDLEGRIECDYSLNGKLHSAVPFTLSLELKPIIQSIDNISTINTGDYEFALIFDVKYTGADYVSIEIEEEYNTSLRNYRFDEPYIAHVKTGNITNLYYSWVTVKVSNKYGAAYELIEFAPIFETKNEDPLIKEVKYNYQLFSKSGDKLDSKGDLMLSLSLPVNTSKLIFEKSKPHLLNLESERLPFQAKSEFPQSSNLSIPNILWGTYFRIRAILADGTDVYSSIYSTNDYMNKDDLEALINSASVEDIHSDDVSLHINNKRLYITADKVVYLSIYDLYGNQIFSGNINNAAEIPLDDVSSPFIIVKYSNSNITKTQKLLVK